MSFLSRLTAMRMKQKRTVKVVWLGLNFSGKTTILQRVTEGMFDEHTRRTLGMNVNEFDSQGIRMVCWDVGGQDIFRSTLWSSYMSGSQGIIFVIDSADIDRAEEAKKELWKYVLANPSVTSRIPILILANKQDLPTALNAGEIARRMDLHKVFNHSYAIFPTSANTGFNLDEALEWLRQRILALIHEA